MGSSSSPKQTFNIFCTKTNTNRWRIESNLKRERHHRDRENHIESSCRKWFRCSTSFRSNLCHLFRIASVQFLLIVFILAIDAKHSLTF
ncbi:hypothetical protein QR98_0041360 [Sarcoptes scabiei]|uniref:Uncharacterized protein n=1 Tax=Sarcoptes scabiei TaxID=52283 RepID=A0A132A491_SARSC|nr:hypothetical protein QR98_0041360 [Sarcoptes scabiei]